MARGVVAEADLANSKVDIGGAPPSLTAESSPPARDLRVLSLQRDIRLWPYGRKDDGYTYAAIMEFA